MAAPSIWQKGVSGHGSQPEDPFDAFLRSPRDKHGELHLAQAQPRHDEDWLVFSEVTRGL